MHYKYIMDSHLLNMSAIMSKASSWTETSSCFAIALVRRPVIFLHTLAANAEPARVNKNFKCVKIHIRISCQIFNRLNSKVFKKFLLRKKAKNTSLDLTKSQKLAAAKGTVNATTCTSQISPGDYWVNAGSKACSACKQCLCPWVLSSL